MGKYNIHDLRRRIWAMNHRLEWDEHELGPYPGTIPGITSPTPDATPKSPFDGATSWIIPPIEQNQKMLYVPERFRNPDTLPIFDVWVTVRTGIPVVRTLLVDVTTDGETYQLSTDRIYMREALLPIRLSSQDQELVIDAIRQWVEMQEI